MGMYTELVLKCDLIRDLPDDVVNILIFLFDMRNTEIQDANMLVTPDHAFFKTVRWRMIGRCSSVYHIPETFSYFKKENRYLFTRCDLKNYDNEIDLFMQWLDPYLDHNPGEFLGWVWYEEYDSPTFIYKAGDSLEEVIDE